MKYEKTFPTKREDEKIVLFLRRHWLVLFRHFVVYLLEFVAPVVIYILYTLFIEYEIDKEDPLYIIIIMGTSLYYLFIGLFFFHDWLDYHLDIWIVTNQRILNIEQNGLFNRVVSEHNISMVQDVTSEVKGRVATFLDFGQVHVQTASEEQRFVFEQVPHPRDVVTAIINTRDHLIHEQQHHAVSEKLNQHLHEIKNIHEDTRRIIKQDAQKSNNLANFEDEQIDFVEKKDEDETI